METTRTQLDRALTQFHDEWASPEPYIEAFTSGSTGTPKRIMLQKADMYASAFATCRRFDITSKSLLHLCLSPRYIAGKMMLVRSYISGAKIIAEEPSNHPLADYHGERISLSAIVPSQIDGLISSGAIDLIDTIIVGGAPMSAEQEQRLTLTGVDAYATYGMTETCSHVALRRVATPLYTAMPGISFSTDHRGCLIIHAPHYTFGQLTTNDIVTLHDDRSFEWRGRYDNVINSGGIKIFPEEIERRLAPFFGDTDFYIAPRQSDKWGTEAVLVTVRDFSTDTDIMTACRQLLPHTHCPKDIIRLDAIARTPNGKLLRQSIFPFTNRQESIG